MARILVCTFALISALALSAFADLQDENAVKVAFVFNFTKYVEWSRPTQDLVVGVIGDGPMAHALQASLSGRSSESRTIRVIVDPSDAQLEQCSIVYVTLSSPRKVRAALERLRGKGVLTVGDADFFARQGGMIGLVTSGDQIEIQVNLHAAEAAGLKISSRLLNLAKIVEPTAEAKN